MVQEAPQLGFVGRGVEHERYSLEGQFRQEFASRAREVLPGAANGRREPHASRVEQQGVEKTLDHHEVALRLPVAS